MQSKLLENFSSTKIGEQFKEFHIFVRFVKLRVRELLHKLICLLLISKILINFFNLLFTIKNTYF